MRGVAFSGKLKSGKSTIAEKLYDTNQPAIIASFAGPLKSALAILGIVKGHPLYRPVAQHVGADIVRDYDPDWWVNVMDSNFHQIERSATPRTLFIIDDVRFQNELEWAETHDFLTVRVLVSPETQMARGASAEQLPHVSETALDEAPDNRFGLVIPEQTTVAQRLAMVCDASPRKGRDDSGNHFAGFHLT